MIGFLFSDRFESLGDDVLTGLLIALALVLIGIALFNHNVIFKAATAVWVLFP